MKAVILAGGLGTRLSEETSLRPKPMVEIGGKPILWHIMKYYSKYNINEFIICCGYKGYFIKEYFVNYFYHNSDITVDLSSNTTILHQTKVENWKVTLIDTGENTMTGGRLKRVANYVKDDEAFCFTYGDGLSNIDLHHQLKFHSQHNKLATMSIVKPPARFGAVIKNNENLVTKFMEKPVGIERYINGGFFILSPKCIDYIDNDTSVWEGKPLETITALGQLVAYEHNDFWQPMDTLRDKIVLEKMIANGDTPWLQS